MSGWIDIILTWLFVLVGLVMTFFILLQEGKGGGLAALGGTKAAGVEGVTNPIRRATAYMAGLFFILAIILGILHKPAPRISLSVPAAAPAAGAGAPKTDAPKTDAPKTDAPKTDAPKTDAAKTDAPKTDAPKTDAPKTDAPKTDAPAGDKPAETPKADAAKPAEAPKTDAKPDEPKK
ncbi:MAG TPA: preprotein translocase subunit SecG [Planctomycetota bacterium]|nr:preprotein translocase subunit SecG [Planctomycetota bacterium]